MKDWLDTDFYREKCSSLASSSLLVARGTGSFLGKGNERGTAESIGSRSLSVPSCLDDDS